MRQVRRRFAPNPKKWKPGEMKAYLAEQRAIAQGRENDRVAGEMYRAHLEWVKRVQADWRRTCKQHIRKASEDAGSFSPFSSVNPQYEEQLKQQGVLIVEK